MRFKNKVVIVTGGASGIGAATALLMAEEGANVVIADCDEDHLKTIQETTRHGDKVSVIKADVTKTDDANRTINETIDKYGKLDVLVNNAGILRSATTILDGQLFDSYDDIMNTNVRAAVYLTTLAAPHLVKAKGTIVNISSIAAKSAKVGFSAYCTSKAALEHFSRCAALELGAHDVRVNTVSPGKVETNIYHAAGLGALFKKEHTTVLKRCSQPDEVAKLIAFLASDDAVGITGSDFLIDNGYLLKK